MFRLPRGFWMLIVVPVTLAVWAWWQGQPPAVPQVKVLGADVLALYASSNGSVWAVGKETEGTYSQAFRSSAAFEPHHEDHCYVWSPCELKPILNVVGWSCLPIKRPASFAQYRLDGQGFAVWEHDPNGQTPIRLYGASRGFRPPPCQGIIPNSEGDLAQLSPDFKWLSIVKNDPYNYGGNWFWKPAHSSARTAISPMSAQVQSSSFSDDSRFVFIALSNGTVQKWSVQPLRQLCSWGKSKPAPGGLHQQNTVVASPDGIRCLWRHSSTFEILDCTTGRTIQLPDSLNAARFSPDGNKFVLFASQGAKLFNARAGQELLHLPVSSNVTASTFSPNSQFLFVGDASGTITRWKLK